MFALAASWQMTVDFLRVFGWGAHLRTFVKEREHDWKLVAVFWSGAAFYSLGIGTILLGYRMTTLGKIVKHGPYIYMVAHCIQRDLLPEWLLPSLGDALVTVLEVLVQRIEPGVVLRRDVIGPVQLAKAFQIAVGTTLLCFALVCFLIGIVELAFHATWLILVEASWTIVYFKLADAFFGPFRTPRLFANPGSPRDNLAQSYFAKRASYLPVQRSFDVLRSQVSFPAFELQRLTVIPNVPQQLVQETLVALSKAVNAELQTRLDFRPLSRLSASAFIHELAGTIIHLLRLPRLQHLARPFRVEAFLPFLMSFPGWKLYSRYAAPSGLISPLTLDAIGSAEIKTFHLAVLPGYLLAATAAGVDVEHVPKLLFLHLRIVSTGEAAEAAEAKLFQAILDAVLGWKAQKLELDRARRRIKQD
ncbi:hypothetical protein JCM10207_004030 [Rhodosporidiobolus poonsookiae]